MAAAWATTKGRIFRTTLRPALPPPARPRPSEFPGHLGQVGHRGRQVQLEFRLGSSENNGTGGCPTGPVGPTCVPPPLGGLDIRRTRRSVAMPAPPATGLPDRVILEEVQRVPSLFTSLKQEIDRHRVSGRFLLTGSSQVLLLPMLSDSLAGRLEIIHLHPLSQCELEGASPISWTICFSEGLGLQPLTASEMVWRCR